MSEASAIEARLLESIGAPVMPGRDRAALRSLLRYHLDEYRLQRSQVGAAGLLDRPGLVRGRVLDVGCGLGQLLLTAGQSGPTELLAGIDIDRDMLRGGALLARLEPAARARPALLAGDALRLPFRDGAFDLVTCRVVLMSLPVSAAVRELARVVRPGGHLYLHLTGWGYYLDQLRGRRLPGALFALANGTLLHLFGRQVRLRGLWNNHETRRAVTRMLDRSGLSLEAAIVGPRHRGAPLNHKILARRPAPAGR